MNPSSDKERARTDEGRFMGDNPETEDINEAYKPTKYYLIEEEVLNLLVRKIVNLPRILVDPTTHKVISIEGLDTEESA